MGFERTSKFDAERMGAGASAADPAGMAALRATPMQEVMYAATMLGTLPGVDIEHIEIDCPTGIHAD